MNSRDEEWRIAFKKIREGARAEDQESPTLEFKEDAQKEEKSLADVAAAVRCLANANGGVVVLGVANGIPGPAAFKGTTAPLELVQRRVFELSRPPLTVDARETREEGNRVAVVYVPRSPELHGDPQGRTHRRVGTDCVPLTPGEITRLRQERMGWDWSAEPSPRKAAQVLPAALAAARTRLAGLLDDRRSLARLTDEDLLGALRLLDGRGRLLRAGELLLCEQQIGSKAPAVVYQYRQSPGGEPRIVERLGSPLLLAMQRTMDFLRARRNMTPVNLPDGQQVHVEDFPEAAVREAVVNALIHRDYQLDEPVSIEHSPETFVVTSPGPLVSGVTVENILTHPSKPRNPVLAMAVRTLGLAEEVGRGVDRMFREMIRSGKEVPRIEDLGDRVRLTLVGGAPNTQIARFVAQLRQEDRDDTDTMLILHHLCRAHLVDALQMSTILQKTTDEAEVALRRLATDRVGILEPTRQTLRRAHPSYRLRGDVLKALGSAVRYQRRTMDEIDRKVIAHVQEYGIVTNRTVQNLLDVGVQRARAILADLVGRRIIVKTSEHERGPGVEYGPGRKFPAPRRRGSRRR
jgi:ATP-dependent DNA helicase RecG